MSVPVVIVARHDSQRLAGKVLRKLGGRSILEHVACRARKAGDADVVLATSDRQIDDPVADEGRRLGLTVFRGSAHNVADRVYRCAKTLGYDRITRICGDSPFFSPDLTRRVADTAVEADADLATTNFPRTWPIGASVECIRTDSLGTILDRSTAPEDLEHVTRYFYNHPESFEIINVPAEDDRFAETSLAIDTPMDLKRSEYLVETLGQNLDDADLDQLVALTREWRRLRPAEPN